MRKAPPPRSLAAALCALFLPATPGATGGVTAFVNVTVIPMDSERVIAHQTVLIQGGVIRAVGPATEVAVPRGARIVHGEGRWLMPGLADMHTHIDDPADLPLLLAAGVTTTLNMGGASRHYIGPVRRAIRRGDRLGPDPLIALMIDGPGDPGGSAVVPATTSDAREVVRRARRDRYDFLKIYSRLTPEMFEAVMEEAARVRIPVVGHVVRSVGLERGLERGERMVAHAEEYLTVFGDGPPDTAAISGLVRLTAQHQTFVTANIAGIATIAAQWGHPERVRAYLEAPGAERLRPDIRAKWRLAPYARLSGFYDAEARFCEQLVAALHRAQIPILVGTDAPDIPGVAPGQSVIDEIDALHRAGFRNYEALAAATTVADAFVAATLPDAARFGVVEVGRRADLLLLGANPLDSLAALREPYGVMVRGRWLPAARLAEMVNAPVAGYARAEAAIVGFTRDIDVLGAEASIRKHRTTLSASGALRIPLRELLVAGYRQVRANHPEGARALFQFASELFPGGWEAFDALGDLLASMGDSCAASIAWRRSYALNPKNSTVRTKIGLATQTRTPTPKDRRQSCAATHSPR